MYIKCKDRTKLLFDTGGGMHAFLQGAVRGPCVALRACGRSSCWHVRLTCPAPHARRLAVCTLADLQFDIYHATIDSDQDMAMQEYYIRWARPGRAGGAVWVGGGVGGGGGGWRVGCKDCAVPCGAVL